MKSYVTILKNSSLFLFLLFSVKGIACSCSPHQNFCEFKFSDNESSILMIVIERDSFYSAPDSVAWPQYYDARIVETLFGPDLGIDSMTLWASGIECEYRMTDIMDTIIFKVDTFFQGTIGNYPSFFMLTPCLNNFLQVKNTKVFGNFKYLQSLPGTTDTMAYLDFLDWYQKCALSSGTDIVESFAEVRTFPNPTTNLLNLNNLSNKTLDFALFNSQGQIIKRGLFNANITSEIDLSEFPTGVYYLRLDDGLEQKSKKILKL